ncbi:MAG: AsmA family protein [Betaproteobacteria bacterium]|nr:AsmA family protein [Betaproteobacteria bacterium]MDH3412751.1 AsmA family protein [Gammaproteobacteria bacterium]
MKIVKYVVIAFAGLIVVVIGVIAYVSATFDPNQYKPQIVKAVKDKTQRTLTLDGDIKLSFWPSIGAKVGKASLSERSSDKQFAAVEEVRVAVKLMPLLSKQVIVDTVDIKGLRATLVKTKEGKTNVDDLAGAPPPAKQTGPAPEGGEADFKVDIARVEIDDAAINYIDQAAGAKYALSKLNLKTGRIAPGVPTDVELSVHAQADKPKLNLQVALKTRLTFDPAKQRLALEGLDLDAKGDAVQFKGLVASAKGDIDLSGATKELSASKFTVTVTGKQDSGDVKIRLEAPKLAVTKDRVSGERMMLEAVLNDAKSKLNARLDIPEIAGSAKAFKSAQINASVDLQQEGMTVKAKLASPVTGSVDAQRLELSKLTGNVSVKDPNLPKSPIEATITGTAAVDLLKQTASLVFKTRVDESNIDGRVGLAKFTPPSYTFDINVDKLDADRYIAKGGGKPAPASKPAPGAGGKAGEQPLDFSALKGLNANGSVKIGQLKASNVKASNVRIDIKAANGRLDVSPLSANLYRGSMKGAVSVQAAQTPVITLKQTLTGVDMGPLLKDAADFDTLEGRGDVSLDVTGRGNTVSALKKALNGNAAIKLADGAIKGIDVAGTLRNVKSKLGALKGQHTQAASGSQKTDFSELSGTFNIKNGVARNNDLQGKSPLLRLAGEGEIDIGQETLNYLVKASVVATSKGQSGRELTDLTGITVPVRLTGTFAKPSYSIDFSGVAGDVAKRELQRQLEQRLGGSAAQPGAPKDGGTSGGSIKDQLKGIFGR